jgi:hypothetical protein
MAASCIATLVLGVTPGVVASMVLSLVVFVALTTQPRVEELGRVTGSVIYRHIGGVGVMRVNGVKIVRFLAPLFFANAPVLKDRVLAELARRAALPPKLRWRALVLCFAPVSSVDSTSIQVLDEIVHECHAIGVPLLIASANAFVEEALGTAGFIDRLGGGAPASGRKFLFRRVHEAVTAVLLHRITAGDLPALSAPRTAGGSGGAGAKPGEVGAAALGAAAASAAAPHEVSGHSGHIAPAPRLRSVVLAVRAATRLGHNVPHHDATRLDDDVPPRVVSGGRGGGSGGSGASSSSFRLVIFGRELPIRFG